MRGRPTSCDVSESSAHIVGDGGCDKTNGYYGRDESQLTPSWTSTDGAGVGAASAGHPTGVRAVVAHCKTVCPVPAAQSRGHKERPWPGNAVLRRPTPTRADHRPTKKEVTAAVTLSVTQWVAVVAGTKWRAFAKPSGRKHTKAGSRAANTCYGWDRSSAPASERAGCKSRPVEVGRRVGATSRPRRTRDGPDQTKREAGPNGRSSSPPALPTHSK